MTDRMITGLHIDVVNNEVKVKTVPDTLESYHDLIQCDLIDIPHRSIGGEVYDIVCDDEGLLKDPKIPSAFQRDSRRIMLVGNLFIVRGNDSTGELESLTAEDIDRISPNIYIVKGKDGFEDKTWPVVMLD